MKLNIGDSVTVKSSGLTLRVNVEDSSKGDVIQAKVESCEAYSPQANTGAYEIGKVYTFERKDIEG